MSRNPLFLYKMCTDWIRLYQTYEYYIIHAAAVIWVKASLDSAVISFMEF